MTSAAVSASSSEDYYQQRYGREWQALLCLKDSRSD